MDVAGKTILFVGGGIETVPGVQLAREMGLRVLVSDRNPQAPCFIHADGTLTADTYDPKATLLAVLDYQRNHPAVDGVICLGSDIPWTCAVVAHALGLPGIPLSAAAYAMDKTAMKQRFAEANIAVPFFAAVSDETALARVIAARGLPLVVKPVDSRGARGVIRLTAEVDPAWAFAHARAQSPTGRVMVEAYLSGPQLSTESLFVNGRAHTPGFADRNYGYLARYAPFFIEDGGDLPTALPDTVVAEVKALIERAGAALGIRDGVVKGDIVIHEGRPFVIELAARLSGGYFCSHLIPLSSGVELVRQAILGALGAPMDEHALVPAYNRHVCQRYLFPKPGVVQRVAGLATVQAMPGVVFAELRVVPGDEVIAVESHPARAGVVIAQGGSRAEAQAVAEGAIAALVVETA